MSVTVTVLINESGDDEEKCWLGYTPHEIEVMYCDYEPTYFIPKHMYDEPWD